MTNRPASLDVAALVAEPEEAMGTRVSMPLQPASTSREALREGLRRAIELGLLRPGTRLRRGNDIAREVGLSRSTVSAAMHDLVHDGLIDRCSGGGAVVRTREDDHVLVRVVPLTEEVEGVLVEEVGILDFPGADARIRRFTQYLWGRKVAEVRIDCEPRWWSPAPTLRWRDRLAPRRGVVSATVQVHEVLESSGDRLVHVQTEYVGALGTCIVETTVVKGLYEVQMA
ncbi:hypothetical protein C1N91_07915 [Curtobacterium sp. SGAir0471]|uniref:GntR family transcriptional regulator n=1 Tax=unclassified Curtobacterium TaxID=257496 RepID=UPI0010CD170A|nr:MULTISPECIES: GntR family transcriptional regulator [unclassified Curtobacterium]MDT0234832.1 GntR family transcriptional regulator [Curtobacterium sp. BRB10]QCR43484.1 hypothetical protein C1N91_07915 [Curtobacterium sp. SGAir0471]